MATIEKRVVNGSVSFRVKVRLKGFPTETATFERQTDAKEWAQAIETKMREGRYFNAALSKKYLVRDAIERYKETILPRKPKSIKDQKRHLDRWEKELGDYSLAHTNAPLIADVRDKLAREYVTETKIRAPGTVNRYMGTLSHLFTVAMKEWGWVHENPVSKLSKLKEPRGRLRVLSEAQIDALLLACEQSDNKSLYTIVVTCLSTGARRNEIVGLERPEIDFNRKAIVLEDTKNGERRVIFLGSFAWSVLMKHLETLPTESHLIFPSPSDSNKPIDIQTAWETALKRAKIEDFRFHDLRHCAASYLAMNGASLAEISEILGHKTLSMVKRYAHLTEKHTAKVIESMNKKIFGNTKKTENKNQKARPKAKKSA